MYCAAAAAAAGAATVAMFGKCSTTCNVLSLHFLIILSFSLSFHFSPSVSSIALVAARHVLRRPFCRSQCWSVTDLDPPRISPPHHIPFWCMGCLELLDPMHESRLSIELQLILLSFLRPFLCLKLFSFHISLFSEAFLPHIYLVSFSSSSFLSRSTFSFSLLSSFLVLLFLSFL